MSVEVLSLQISDDLAKLIRKAIYADLNRIVAYGRVCVTAKLANIKERVIK